MLRTDARPRTSVGQSFNVAGMAYGGWWRRHRRAFWQYFRPQAIAEYQPVQRSMARRFLLKLLQNPTDFEAHMRLYVVPFQ